MYDSRAWLANGRSPVTANEVNTLEVVQAYVAVDAANAFGDGTFLSLQGGRFLLNIGSRHLVAADDYRNTTNSYTGLRADLVGKSGLRGTFIYVLPQVRLPDDLDSTFNSKARFDREPSTRSCGAAPFRLRNHWTWRWPSSASIISENGTRRAAQPGPLAQYGGGRTIRDSKAGAIDYEVEAHYQFGHVSSGLAANAPRLDVSAYFVHGDIGYSFAIGWKPRVSLEFDRASEDGPGGSYGRFDALFDIGRADLAPAGLYNAVDRANISTPGLRIKATRARRSTGSSVIA